jgi:polyphosphate kinase
LDEIMVMNLKDTLQSWKLGADGTWRRLPAGDAPVSAHDYFMINPSLSGRGADVHDAHPAASPSTRHKHQDSVLQD